MCVTEFWTVSHPPASANQNATITGGGEGGNDEWPPCFLHKLKHSNGAKDSVVDSEQILQNKQWRTFADGERYHLE